MRRVPERRLVWLAGLAVAVLAVAWQTGFPFLGSSESVDDIEEAANRYARLLADGDLQSVDDMVGLTVRARQDGVTVSEAVKMEAHCLDWSLAEARIGVSTEAPWLADVTYSDGRSELTRVFNYQGSSWHVTLDDPVCNSASS